VRYFVRQFAASMDKVIGTISEETVQSLVRFPWPGNIRELKSYLARGVILSTGGIFAPVRPEWHEPAPVEISRPTLQDKLRQEIVTACQLANWKIGGPRGAAARLGLTRTTLVYKMKRLGIAPPADH
jgi:formate hydrogenlyase transcriptional activator